MPRTKKAGRKAKQNKDRIKRTKEEWEEMKRQNPELAAKSEYVLAPKSNDRFEKYYSGIGIVPEEEWNTFLDYMRKPLPTTFRITGSRNQAQELLKIIKGQYFSQFVSESSGLSKLEPVSLPWYHDELAWQLNYTKKEIKNDKRLKSLHNFMISETESGNISRQEAVSMLPPLLLDIESHHKILDMCAAPGSKTAQLIEMLHNDENVPVPEGFVVANDMDNKRCYLMTHQVKRIQSPNCMIINHDARVLPNMLTSNQQDAPFVKYDRILCDVPCSGDGTMRKNPDIWTKWSVNGAHNLHSVQKKVLQRGLELLAVGGRLVYSTCSLNPIEDEAVILTLIKLCEGSIELVDVSDKLTGLKYSKGTYSWKVLANNGTWYETEEQAPESFNKLWDSTIYPPLITEAQDAKLERCIRVLPHQQNTGAFFIAVLQKTKELPWSSNRNKGIISEIDMNERRKDEGEKKQAGSEHFSFNIKHKGSYKHGKCNLCEIILQSKNDYDTHRLGKRHQFAIAKHAMAAKDTAETDDKSVTEGETKQDDVKMDTNSDNVNNQSANSETVDKDMSDSNTNTGAEKTENNPATENGTKDSNVATSTDNGTVAESGDNSSTAVKRSADDSVADGGDKEEPPAKKGRYTLKEDDEIPVRFFGHREDPFYFCSKTDPIWPSIKNFYGVTDDLGVEQIMYRNMKRVLYYVSKPIRNLVLCNTGRVKFINLGVKCFTNAPSPLVPDCDFRLSQEGLLAVQTHIQGRRVELMKEDVITILSQENPFIYKLTSKVQEEVHKLDPGSCLFHFKPTESDPEPNVEIVFCGWRGKTSVRSFVGKDERAHYLRICGVELSDVQAKVMEKKALREDEGIVASRSGADTPVGVASGDEAELEQWNKDTDIPRRNEEDDREDSRLSFPKTVIPLDTESNADQPMTVETEGDNETMGKE